MKNWLIKFNPDFIFINPDKEETILFAIKIANFLDCKIIIHVMDDKVNKRYQGIIGYYDKRKFKYVFSKIVHQANVCLSISEKMAVEYYKKYKKVFYSFHNPININDWNQHIKNNWDLNNEIKIVYSGFIGSTIKPILEFCEAIKQLNEENFKIKLILYSKFNSHFIVQSLKKYSFIEFNDYVLQSMLPKVLTSADFLFLPLSFEKEAKYTKLSMPTKTAEYMISGVPVILYAPTETALAEYAKKGNWAYLVTSNKTNNLKSALKILITERQVRTDIAKNAVLLAKKNHDILQSQKEFMKILMSDYKTNA